MVQAFLQVWEKLESEYMNSILVAHMGGKGPSTKTIFHRQEAGSEVEQMGLKLVFCYEILASQVVTNLSFFNHKGPFKSCVSSVFKSDPLSL